MVKQIQDDKKYTGNRLPKDVRPIHYDLWLKPNLEEFTFSGKVKIDYEAVGTPNCIIVNTNEIDIKDGSIDDSNPLTTVTYSKESETATLEFERPIVPRGTLSLSFSGILNDTMKGFYRSEFTIDGQSVHAATTQFEATDARRSFPCWDEPAIKATFSVTLVISKWIDVAGKRYECLALSNMPEVCRSGPDHEQEVRFDKSPIMSTYLLAYIVGPFEMIEANDGRRPVRVYTAPGKTEQGRFALEVACKSLRYYEDYFGIEYPLPKMDMIAVPDFSSGAMENWGLVTYRETCLLVDPKNTSTLAKQYVALVVAHELAHQWFGNIVTMEWWTHLWLNEGFATFMEYLCVDHIFPEYDVWSQFVTDVLCRALELDSLHNSHPIEVPVNHPSEIDEIFDNISYNKGASVIRMLHHYIGDECFRKGLNGYLEKFAYKNAITEDLWDSLEAASNKPVRRLMTGWTSQLGYPILSVTLEGSKLKVTQTSFTADGKPPADNKDKLWLVPISTITGKDPKNHREACLLETKSGEITIPESTSSWFKLNPGTVGIYRTSYPAENMTRLLPAIADKTLPPMDRLGIQSDYFALCQAGSIGAVELLQLMQAFKGEDSYPIWRSIDSCLGYLSTVLNNTDLKEKLQAYGRQLYADIFNRLTWTPKAGEDDADAITRALVIDRLVKFGDPQVVEEAKRRFVAHVNKQETIPADLRGACYNAASMYGDGLLFHSLLGLHYTLDLQEEKNRVVRALGYTKDPQRLKQVIDFAFSDAVRNQDKVFVLLPIGVSNPQAAFDLLRSKKDKLREMYSKGHMMPRIVKFTTENFNSEERAAEVEKFFQENKFPGAERTIQQSLETIRLNAGLLRRDSDALRKYLASF